MSLSFFTPGVLPTPERLVRPGASWRAFDMPTTVAVVELDPEGQGDVVLIDAGFSAAEMQRPAMLGLPHGAVFRPKGRPAVEILIDRGISPDRVTAIVATHLHLDHIGAYVDFPNAQVIAPAAEFAYARRRGSAFGFPHVEPILHSGRARPVTLVRAERHGFPGYKALFDGRILLLDARGHTGGSVAVLATAPETDTAALMIGDAAYSRHEYRTGESSLLMAATGFSQSWVAGTWARIAAFEQENGGIPVVPSHCSEALGAVCRHH